MEVAKGGSFKEASPGFKERVQGFGRFLSGMVMPNIGAFIAWGLITALFIPKGWIPNEKLSTLVGPMISYLLPLLIGYTGGKMVADVRGGVIGAIATMGVIVGSDIPMLMGAMIMGPLGGYVIKKFDKAFEGKIPAGFEMLVNNFSAGIIGTILALLAFIIIGPVVASLNAILANGVGVIVDLNALPLVSLFVEPGKILFLNNAINHGILGPIGLSEAKELGKSVFFLLESNPGPGLGVLLAYFFFAKGSIKESAPSSIIIHFLGGIHEIYFPYVLMNPLLILAVIAGGAAGVLTFTIFGAGLVAAPSPGSILALLAMTPRGGYFGVLAGVTVATVVSFLVASIFVKASANRMNDEELEKAKQASAQNKGLQLEQPSIDLSRISRIIFACDAGMGSSAMGASMLGKKLKQAGMNIPVVNFAINEIPLDAQMVVTHQQLTQRAKNRVPNAYHISVTDFLDKTLPDKVIALLKDAPKAAETKKSAASAEKSGSSILKKSDIFLGQKAADKFEAIKMVGKKLSAAGYVDYDYVQAMVEREKDVKTYVGRGFAIPHGTGDAKKAVKRSGIVVMQFPQGIQFDDEVAYVLVGIAGKDNEHLDIIAGLASVISEGSDEDIEKMHKSSDVDFIYKNIRGE